MEEVQHVHNAESFWIENMNPKSNCIFDGGDSGKFQLERHGMIGSISEVARQTANDPYVKRAVARGKLRLLTQSEAYERMEELEAPTPRGRGMESIMENLEKGASERVSRYSRSDLPEDGESGAPMSTQQIWGDQVTQQQSKPKTVQRAVASVDDGPVMDPSQVLAPTEYGDNPNE